MSWLVSSIANSLKLEDEADDVDATKATAFAGDGKQESPNDQNDALSPSDDVTSRSGVKEDLSEFSKTLSRQFWGVASFLAPPRPDSHISDPRSQSLDRSESFDHDDSDSAGIAGIRSDLLEIRGKFRTGISKLSSNKAVSEFTKIASDFLQFVSEEDGTIQDYTERGVVGVTEEVVAFARDIAMHPKTWLDFPLPDEDEEENFDMSDTQQEHALAVERLASTLAALRMELCPGYMSEGCFWKIYFVLVHPRLTRHDAELLSTSQIVRARAILTQELQTRAKSKHYGSGKGTETVASETASLTNDERLSVTSKNNPESLPTNISVIEQDTAMDTTKSLVDKDAFANTEIAVIEEASTSQINNGKPDNDASKDVDRKYDEDVEDWLKEEIPEMGNSRGKSIPIEDDDISFSDLEEGDEEIPITYERAV